MRLTNKPEKGKAMILASDFNADVKVGDSLLASVVPGWTIVGVVSEIRESSVKLSPSSWVETLSNENTVSHLQHSKKPREVAERAWGMRETTIPYQAICWYARMEGDAKAFSLEVEALKRSR